MSRQNRLILKPHKLQKIWVLILGVLAVLLCLTRVCIAETVEDHRGRTFSFDKPYKRIISLYGAHTENLFYLGAADQIIGVSINDAYPEEVSGKQRFSYHDDPEKFLSTRPDLVLIRPMIENGYPQFVNQLRSYGIVVMSFQPSTIDKVFDYWITLGKLTGKNANAQDLVSNFKAGIQEIKDKTHEVPNKKKVYFQSIHRRMKTFTPGAMPIFALETAGGINVAKDAKASRNTNVAIYGKEQILAKAPEIDVFLAQKGIMNPIQAQDILNEPGFHIIKAVKENQIFLIDENIVSRPVPRLYQGILTIGKILYPEIFSSITTQEDLI